MRQIKIFHLKRLLKVRSPLFIFLYIGLFIILFESCNSNEDQGTSKGTGDTGLKAVTTNLTMLYKLELSYDDYIALRESPGPAGPKANMIVLQFVYDKSYTRPLTLVGYSARANHKFNHAGFTRVVKYLKPVADGAVVLPDLIILGDQQVRFVHLDALLAGAPTPPTEDTKFIFTPVLDADGKHIRFDICLINPVHCPAPGVPTQPSPPADANP